MLNKLYIKNFALIEELQLEFSDGLNIITGETGAGKSIIIDALMLALGERASTGSIRSGETKAVIEAHFKINRNNPVTALLKVNDYDTDEDELIIHREILDKGKSRAFLNDTPIQVSLLKEVGDFLVDFHGQHDHQLLLKRDSHIGILDIISGNEALLAEYRKMYLNLKKEVAAYEDLVVSEKELKEKVKFQMRELEEINKIAPKEGEFVELTEELNILENHETLFALSSQLSDMLYVADSSIHNRLTEARQNLEQLANIDSKFSEYLNEFKSAIITIDEIAKFAQDYSGSIEFDSERTEEVRQRLLLLNRLIKEYGTFDAVFERKQELEAQLNLAENFDEEKEKSLKSIHQQRNILTEKALMLSDNRKKGADKLKKAIEKTLAELGINKAAFETSFAHTESEKESLMDLQVSGKYLRADRNGIDRAEFLISMNAGEQPKPLAAIASGGEISRVMLAIKSLIAESDSLPILVFDEIDTGISGRIAQKVGKAMQELSKSHQIISITHLPQIAALAERNISVAKIESDNTTSITARILNHEEKLSEVAKMLSGENITEAALKSAAELANI